MPNPRLAGRYAKSLIDLAVEKNQLDEAYQDMLFLQKVCTENKDFVSMLKSPVINADKKEKILEAVTKNRVTVLTDLFNKLLVKKSRESYLPEIAKAFIQQYKDHQNIFSVKLTTAVPVSEELKKVILDKIRTETAMQHLELQTEVNESLIGGFVLEIGDHLVDTSISYDLNNVRKQFRNNDFIYKVR
jgi:F-type H+-transporting ATPase subunit delta